MHNKKIYFFILETGKKLSIALITTNIDTKCTYTAKSSNPIASIFLRNMRYALII